MSASRPAPGTPLSVTMHDVSVDRADRPVLVDVNLTFTETTRAAVVGPNGVGKSTLLRVLCGRLRPDRGSVTSAPPDATIGLLDQEPRSATGATVRQLVADRLGVTAAEADLAATSAALAEGVLAEGVSADGARAEDRYQRALERYLSLGAADLPARLEQVAAELGLAPRLLDAEADQLSGGEAERVGLAIVMLSRFDLTLLDEPTNNLDRDGLARLEQWVSQHRGGLVLVSHDRVFLEQVVNTVIEIDHHHHTASEFHGGWQAFVEERAIAAARAEQRFQQYVDERDKLSRRVQTQREWADQGVHRAKKHPADGDKFRRNWQLDQTEQLAGRAKATQKTLDRLETVDKPWRPWDLRFTIDRAARSAGVVAAFDNAVLARGDFVLGPLNLELRWAERLAVVGANGSGKSTLIDGMLGRLPPRSGSVKLGSGVVVGELDQTRTSFNPTGPGQDPSLLRAFQDASGLVVADARSVLAKFGLDAEAVGRAATSLSPGERTRARLALFQVRGINLLVLDEPTNHLDLVAIEQLESALAGFDGTLVLVTHDRRLLENVQLDRTIDLDSLAESSSPAAQRPNPADRTNGSDAD